MVALTYASLFTGIGGFDLPAQHLGWDIIFQVENDDYCQKILKKHFPKSTLYGDIKNVDFTPYENKIDIITAGMPCQPFSVAGEQKGRNDERYLWDEMLRAIREIQPVTIIIENVVGIINMELGNMLDDLENETYQCQTFCVPACGVGAWHQRERVFVICYSMCHRQKRNNRRQSKNIIENTNKNVSYAYGEWQLQQNWLKQKCGLRLGYGSENVTNSDGFGRQNRISREQPQIEQKTNELGNDYSHLFTGKYWNAEPSVGRVAYGVSHRLDRIKALGNAVVPQVAHKIFQAVEKCFFSV